MKMRHILLCEAATLLGVALASVPAVAKSSATEDNGLGDIVVTAQKREQSINDVGMTIQAATSETLTARGIADPADLVKIVPGFTYTESLYATPVYTLRGIGLYDTTFGGAPSVAIYTDQIPRNVPVMSSVLDLDLERVEVLKGPQGTLFGQSATGGAINYITAKPTETFEAGLDGSYERFGKFTGSAFVSGPISDTLRARLAVGAVEGGAWQYSITQPEEKNGATRRLNGRLTLDWVPTDRARFEFSASGARDRSDPLGYQFTGSRFNIYSGSTLAAANADPATTNPFGVVNEELYADYTNPLSPGFDPTFLARQDAIVRRMNGNITAPNIPDLAQGSRIQLGSATARNARQADWTPGFHRRNDNNYYQFTLRGDYDLTDEITLTSITALAKQNMSYVSDLDGTSARGVDVTNFGTVRTFNQEFRLSGDTERLNWMIGASYDNIRSEQDYGFDLAHYSANAPVGLFLTNSFSEFDGQQRTYGGYGNVEFKITDNFTLQGGLRYTENKLKANYCYYDPSSDISQNTAGTLAIISDVLQGLPIGTTQIAPGDCYVFGDGNSGTTLNAPILEPFGAKLTQSNWSFRVGANYELDQGTLLYATVSRGYKAGLFSAIAPTTTDQYDPAVQEKVIAYEAGFKAPLLDRRVQFNGAFFYYDYSDKQVRARVFDPIFGLLEKMVNVPKSYIWGLEAELYARPVDGLTLSASGTYIKSKVSDDFSTTIDGKPIFNTAGYTGNFKGSKLPFTPAFSGNADIQYEWLIGAGLRPFVGASIQYQGKTNATFENAILKADEYRMPGYETVDVRLGLGSEDEKWRVTAFGRNVFNKYYITARNVGLDTNFQTAGRPATYGVALQLRYH